ncbi:hypothetical protein [Phytoactinopolyspora halotolerans]|uniref:Rpn family recombination-promoting nuclease/putative transposase n=1 Tax=Phytoactinopolyspora halotolerans TaxID=1981512 RepID=A0A6L9SFK4_9ACTN|nr:hypothetical protein [Phytoactinopolyspora halotolerans]NEE03242.1 hypothetical protein [Phytoactinopolyspora halotolerans]
MITTAHEALHRIFQDDNLLFSRALRNALGVDFPTPRAVSVFTPDLTDIKPVARHADTVLLIETDEQNHLLVIESQTKESDSKRYSWPHYVSYLYTTHKVPVTLLVVCPDAATATWARAPIRIGLPGYPSQITRPWVLGPDNVPPITDTEQAAEDIVWAVFSALTHRLGDKADDILVALAEALNTVDDPGIAGYWAEFTEIGLGNTAARDIWRNLMSTLTYHYPSQLRLQGREEGREEGRAEGQAGAVLEILNARGVDVSEDTRARITDCTDHELLRTWIRRAATATSVEDLFG